MFFLTVVAYVSAVLIETTGNKICIYAGVIIPLAVLGIFKYFNFFVSSFSTVWGIRNAATLKIILPVGISFYTFQSLSYTIDVYRKKIRAVRDFYKLALYISFFPQLVAGPIVRASDFIPQLDEDRNVSFANLKKGLQIFIFGLFKKIVIADWLSVFVDDVFSTPAAFHAISIILAIIGYSIQIYFDFSGYSDMAVGCAKCLGYDFVKNFNMPYAAVNLTDFWHRWHISLSGWLKEYLYIPLGGNRKGPLRMYFNQMITMLLGGLWHGANWTFVAWGALHGIALCLHKYYSGIMKKIKSQKKMGKCLEISYLALSGLITYVFVCFCWIFFRAENFHKAKQIILAIAGWQKGIIQLYVWVPVAMTVLISAVIAAIIKRRGEHVNGFYPILDLDKIPNLIIFFTVIGIIAGFSYTGANPFIYFQF
jgi:alginate O-acetyltransferase complex protein AlgI